MIRLSIILILLLFFSCKNDTKNADLVQEAISAIEDETEQSSNFDLTVYNFDQLEPLLYKESTGVTVVNFWATWCLPCVKELPEFQKLIKNYENKNVKLVLVSLDFPHHYESKLKPFIETHKLKGDIVALDDTDMNTWIPKVDSTWTGAIPATLIFNNTKRKFYEQSFTYEALETEVKSFLN